MPKRSMQMTAVDDGLTVALSITRTDVVGGVEIGPIPVFQGDLLSFPTDQVEDWMRDVAVLFVERL